MYPKTVEEEQQEELSKSERNTLLEGYITNKAMLLSSLVNMRVVVLFFGLIQLVLVDNKIL